MRRGVVGSVACSSFHFKQDVIRQSEQEYGFNVKSAVEGIESKPIQLANKATEVEIPCKKSRRENGTSSQHQAVSGHDSEGGGG